MNQYIKIRGPLIGPIIVWLLLLGVALTTARAATIIVTEVGDGFGVHTNLRQALADANDGDTITFDPLLGGRDLPVAAVLGQLVVNKSVTIRWVPTVGYPLTWAWTHCTPTVCFTSTPVKRSSSPV